jgi:hypothetical protein
MENWRELGVAPHFGKPPVMGPNKNLRNHRLECLVVVLTIQLYIGVPNF